MRALSGSDGAAPQSGLVRGADNKLYGTATLSGEVVEEGEQPVGAGTIYRITTTGNFEVVHSFDCSQGEGGDPWGSLIEGPDGALYGMTIPSADPDPDCTEVSTVFKINKNGTDFEVLASFDYLVTGSNQFGPLFRIDESGNFTSLVLVRGDVNSHSLFTARRRRRRKTLRRGARRRGIRRRWHVHIRSSCALRD